MSQYTVTKIVGRTDEKLNCFQFSTNTKKPYFNKITKEDREIGFQYDSRVPENQVFMSAKVAQRFGVKTGDTIDITVHRSGLYTSGDVNEIWNKNF